MVSRDRRPRIDDDGIDDQLPLTPSNNPKARLDMGGGTMKTVLISAAVTFVMLALMSFAGGVSFVTKKDFAANMAGAVATLEQAKADLIKAKSDVATEIGKVPSTISTQVNTTVSQLTSQWSSQLTSLTSKVTELTGTVSTLAGTIATNTKTLDTVNQQLQDTAKYAIETRDLSVALEKRVAELEKQKVVTTTATGGVGGKAGVLTVATSGEDYFYTTPTTLSGYATFTQNNASVVWASGTMWSSPLVGGKIKCTSDTTGTAYKILSVTDASHLTLAVPYSGATATNVAYTLTYDLATIGVRIVLENVSGKDIQDVVIEIPVELDYYGGQMTNLYMSGQSGSGSWYVKTPQWHSFILRNDSRISIDAGVRKKIYFDLLMTFDSAIEEGTLSIDEGEIELIDWDYE